MQRFAPDSCWLLQKGLIRSPEVAVTQGIAWLCGREGKGKPRSPPTADSFAVTWTFDEVLADLRETLGWDHSHLSLSNVLSQNN
ncbi:hypothetical protein [Georgenia yuyongxinii]